MLSDGSESRVVSGDRLGSTVTGTLREPDRPSGSVAVTVSVVEPAPTVAADTTLPATVTVATEALALVAE